MASMKTRYLLFGIILMICQTAMAILSGAWKMNDGFKGLGFLSYWVPIIMIIPATFNFATAIKPMVLILLLNIISQITTGLLMFCFAYTTTVVGSQIYSKLDYIRRHEILRLLSIFSWICMFAHFITTSVIIIDLNHLYAIFKQKKVLRQRQCDKSEDAESADILVLHSQ